MSEFTKQYAIRLPNGLLYGHKPGNWHSTSWGLITYAADEEAESEPVVYDTLEDAEESIAEFQKRAASMGITEWLGRIESRTCSPFTDSAQGEGDDMVADLEQFLKEEQ